MTDLAHTDEWHAQRAKGLGGSDIAAVLGISPWKTPFHLYLEKIGELPRDRTDTPYQRWGKKLEELILDEWSEQTGMFALPYEAPVIHRDLQWALANVDAFAHRSGDPLPREPSDTAGVVEAKSASAYKAKEWADGEIPVAYAAQVQWYLEVTDLPKAWIAVLIGGNDFRVYDMERDADLGQMLLERAGEFWQRVIDRDPPDPDGADSTTEALNRMYASMREGSVVHVDSTAVDLVAEYWRAHEAIAEAEARKAEAANRLRLLMQDGETALCDGQTIATWKAQTSRRVDVRRLKAEAPDLAERFTDETTTRVLRPSKALKE